MSGVDTGDAFQLHDGHRGGVSSTSETLRLRPPRHRVSPRAQTWWTTQAIITQLVLLIPLIVCLIVLPDLRGWFALAIVALLVVGGAYVVVMPRWRFRVHRWEATDDAVYTSAGWISQEWRVAPMSRIQTVDTERGPLQQLFGLATVTVTTASAAGPLRLEGLDHALALDLVKQLTETTQATPGDAT
jgi:membrane protein YdbS with pleckstrin-like domain